MTPEIKPDIKISDKGKRPELGYVKLFNGLPVGATNGIGNTKSCEESCDACFDPSPGCDSCFDPSPGCDSCFDPSPDVRPEK